ncbi:tellurite resistance protein TerC [Pustulibacterium marinum]|uniref:Tellurite resistance protein TerC n=1 Tax=Pustulibacterium marinum TaxID=1224947 RepID=A0A1I7ICY2_9FLAO|nr:TerC family protein [Pustulibacterium marinum]SFU70809.1 tellurite resistance protein TerC [Pustulibacterium marinum]
MVWIIFIALVVICLALDLGVFNKNAHVITNKEAATWTIVWVSVATLFSVAIYFFYQYELVDNVESLKPFDAALKYITGYLIELSLSVDNIFVIAVIFSSFKIPQKYQHRVLFWGIIGAVVFRASMIFFGVALMNKFEWVTYIFGGFLIFTAAKMLFSKEDENYDPKTSFMYRMIGKVFPIAHEMDGEHFFKKIDHKKYATPLFVALIIIEFTDVLFALDSIPAILGITRDSFLVFSSNIMAILGLRSMYFFLANMLNKFEKLNYSLVVILTFVGVKLILSGFEIHLHEWISLAVIGVSLGAGILISVLSNNEEVAE